MSKAEHDPGSMEDLERAEALLLGSLFLHPERVTTVQAMLQPEEFTQERHRLIYETLLTMTGISDLDVVHAMSILLTQNELERVGGTPYLSFLKQQAESTAMRIGEQIYQLKYALLNHLLRQTRETLHASTEQNDSADLKYFIGDLEHAINITRQLSSPKYGLPPLISPLQDDLNDYMSDLNTRQKQHIALTGIPTSFVDLDTITGGLQRADLIVVAGLPSAGKTGFALSIALHVLLQARRSVGLFSLEAPRRQVIGRLLSMQANLDQRLLRSLEMEDDDWTELMGASTRLSEAQLWVDDSAHLSTAGLHDAAHLLVERYGIELLIVDNVHLMLSNIQEIRPENRIQEVGEISRSLKTLARDLNIPILALAQVSRAFESRLPKKFQLSDLRDGSLENDADLVLFLSVGEKETTWAAACRLATITIAKHRNGPLADLDVCFYPGSTRFRDLQTQSPPPSQKKSSLSVQSFSERPLRQFSRLKDILEQGMQMQPKHEELKTALKPSSKRRELPRGYVLEDEEVEGENDLGGSTTAFADEQEQNHA
jgi:replicative DNA helicase